MTKKAIGHTHLVTLSSCEAWLFQPPDDRPLEISLQIDTPENGIDLSMEDIATLCRFTKMEQ